MRKSNAGRGRVAARCALFEVLTIPTIGGAQISAFQGASAADPAKRFSSPMVLLLPVPALRGASTLPAFSVSGVRGYRCEDASIPAMTISVDTSRKGARTFTFSGMLIVDESFDRFVSLELALRDGDGPILARGRQVNISVEEKQSARFRIVLEVDAAKAATIDSAAELQLQITMHVRKDGAGPWTP